MMTDPSSSGSDTGEREHLCGPVWCARRGRSAVVTLVNTPGHPVGAYIQWCSLVGVNLTCDEACVRHGARWVESDEASLEQGLYTRLRDVVIAVETSLNHVDASRFTSWRGWAQTFTAGLCSPRAAWQAAEAARSECVALRPDERESIRQAGLAAEDAAWAVAHAAAGNVSLALQCAATARRLLKAPV